MKKKWGVATGAALVLLIGLSVDIVSSQFSSAATCTGKIRGHGVVPAAITCSPTDLDFGTVLVGQVGRVTLTLANSGQVPGSATVSLVSCPPSVTIETAMPVAVPARGSAPVVFKFAPTDSITVSSAAGYSVMGN